MKTWKAYAVFFIFMSFVWLGLSLAYYFYEIDLLPSEFRKRVGGSWGWISLAVGMTMFVFASYFHHSSETLRPFRIVLRLNVAMSLYNLIEYFYLHSVSEMYLIPVLILGASTVTFIYFATILDHKLAIDPRVLPS